MKKGIGHRSAAVLGTVFIAAVLCCSFCRPFIPGAVYDAVPARATFAHKASSIDVLRGSPVLGQLDKALGAGNSMEALLAADGWIRRFAPSEVAIATLPVLQTGQSPAWVGASWVGWRSPWLRWKLEHARIDGLSFVRKHAVWPIWIYETPEVARGSTLAFALTDNLLVACLSENPADILILLDTYDRRILSMNDVQ